MPRRKITNNKWVFDQEVIAAAGITEEEGGPAYVLTENITVNLTSDMTAAEIQALIDAQPKNLNGYTLTFQFADGTYTLDDQLFFSGFFGGKLTIYGNASDNTLSTTKSVYLNFSNGTNGIYVEACQYVDISYLKLEFDIAGAKRGIYCEGCSEARLSYNYILGDGTSFGNAIHVGWSFAYINSNYVSNTNIGIYSAVSLVSSNNNDDTGTQPAYGLFSALAATIGKGGANQPSGSTSNEGALTGGVIR